MNDLIRVNLTTRTAERVPVPSFLLGLLPESLRDLTWTDPALSVQDYAWWPLVDETPPFDTDTQELGAEILTIDTANKVVRVSHEVVPLPADVLSQRLSNAKSAKLVSVNADCDKRMSALVAGYPEREQQTFDKQETEARAFTADATAATPLIDALALNRGVAKADLAARIIAKADAFADYAGKIIGHRQKLEDQINAAADMAALNAIDIVSGWPV